MTSIRLPETLEMRLDALSALTQRSKSFYIKEALARYLDDMEDAYIALERISSPNPTFYTTQEVLAALKTRKANKKPK